ncbi:MAG: hypothetical protein KIT43_03640 [Bauldia sp.]|nr:hypothetical protein [Bauldia sp.]MCW5717772.1 hypothetical protein [Bauldia sp.]
MADSPLYTIPHPGIWATDAEWQDWYRAVEAAYAARPPDAYPRPGQGREAAENEIRLSIFDGARESEPITVPYTHHALVDRTADGHWLVISPAAERSGPREDSALYASDGRRIGVLPLGDGIETLLCAPDGTIWAGYGGQSIFDPPDNDGGPLSRGGLVQFAARGAPIWAFNGNVEHNGRSLFIHDCPVMTLTGTTLWAWVPNIGSVTADAPATLLVRIRDGTVSVFESGLDDGREIAVAGDTLLVAGSHFEDANRIVAARIGETRVTGLGRLRVDEVARAGSPMRRWPEHLIRRLYEFDQDPGPTPRLLRGRDGILHAVTRATWLRFGAKGVERAADPGDTPPFCRGFSGGWTVYAPSSLPPAPPTAD